MVSSLVFCAFYPFSLSAAGTKALGPEQQQQQQQQYRGLLPYEWTRVKAPATTYKPGLKHTVTSPLTEQPVSLQDGMYCCDCANYDKCQQLDCVFVNGLPKGLL
ncbi:hypothetical protein PAMA_007946 [Pampus argenteus]